MQTRERKFCFRVIDFRRGLPVDKIVALQAILAELAFVNIFMAAHTILHESEKCSAEIFHLDEGPIGRTNMCGSMALVTFNGRVLALKNVTRLAMIEGLERGNPVNQRKVGAVMFRMALRAVFLFAEARMEAAVFCNLLRNFGVALLAL